MRTIRGAVLLSLFLYACGGETPPPANLPPQPTASAAPTTTTAPTAETPPPAPKPTMAESLAKVEKTVVEGFAAGDAKKMASAYAENGVLKMPGVPDMTGREAIAGGAQMYFSAFKDTKLMPVRVFSKGNVAVIHWVMTGTHSGDFMGAKASNKQVGHQGASVLWLNDDGLIKEEHLYWNPPTVLSQVGASKEKGRPVMTAPATTDRVVAQGSSDEERNIAVVGLINQVWEDRDEKQWLTLMVDNAEWDDITMAEVAKGKQGVLKYFQIFTKAFPDAKLASQNVWGIGDYVIEEGTYAGTHTGPLMGTPATKKPFTIHELTIVQLDKDDKIVKGWTFGNDVELMAQLGLMKMPGAK
jgi:steroid delta-isomerase-like uncharacterized protein